MRRLTTALLAVLILCGAAFAQPPGWELGTGNKHRNAAVDADPIAQHRGGHLDLDLDTLTIDLMPWADDDDDHLTAQVILPNGYTVGDLGAWNESGWGWSANMPNGWKMWFVDLEYSRVNEGLAEILPGFDAHGVAAVFGAIPDEDIPLTGDWVIPKLQLGGCVDDVIVAIQTDDRADPDVTQEDWVPYSVALYHATKKNDRPDGAKYTTGKLGHLPRPIWIWWKNSTPVSFVYGRYTYDPVTKILSKVFDTAELWAAQGQGTSGSMSADLGYTTIGASSSANDGMAYLLGTLPAAASITSASAYGSISFTGTSWLALYEGLGVSSFTGLPLVANTGGTTVPAASNKWHVATYATPGSVSSGQDVVLWVIRDTTSGANTLWYDAVAGGTGELWGQWLTADGPPPANMTAPASEIDFRLGSGYMTYDAVGPAPGNGDTGPLGLSIGLEL